MAVGQESEQRHIANSDVHSPETAEEEVQAGHLMVSGWTHWDDSVEGVGLLS